MSWGFCPVCRCSVKLWETKYSDGVIVYTVQNHYLFYGGLKGNQQCEGSDMSCIFTPKEPPKEIKGERTKVSIEEIPCNNTI